MDNLKKYSNDELHKMIDTLSKNHEKLKEELVILHQMLLSVEEDYLNLVNELKSRT